MSTETATPPPDLLAKFPHPTRLAIRFLSAMLDSADPDTIGAMNWWTRAEAALETAVTKPVFSEVVSSAAHKLQLNGASLRTSREIAALSVELSDPKVFAEWRQTCRRGAHYITQMTRIYRENRKKANR